MAEPAKFVQIQKPMGLQINKEQAVLLLKGLKTLPETDQTSVVYQSLLRDVETINTILDRIVKNAKIANEQRRVLVMAKKGIPPKSGQPR